MTKGDHELQELANEIASQLIEDLRHRPEMQPGWNSHASVRVRIREGWPKMIFNRLRDYRDGIE